jgi:predicted GNAT superfamily acetyltransferase
MLNIRILLTNYDIIAYFLNLAFCSEHFIGIKHRILATFNINKKFNSDSLYAFKHKVNTFLYFQLDQAQALV